MHIRVATPEGYLPDKKVMKTVEKYCQVRPTFHLPCNFLIRDP